LAAGGDIWRVGLPRADASADCGGESCRSMEQHAEYKSSNNRDAEPDGERTTSRDRAGDCTGTGGVDRPERDDTPPVTLTPLTRTATQNACGPDGVNSICFDQADMAFTPGVLAFTRVISTDRLGVQVGSSAVSTQLGQILDADIYFNPSDSRTAFATPQALAAAPTAYDFESVLTYELGHFLGSSHSAAWRAIMFPFAPAPGTFSGMRPTMQQPDAPLGDDDRNGSARSLCRPGGRGAQRIDQRAHFSRESTGAPGLASGRDGRFRRASGRRGCDERRSCGSDDRRVELHGSWPRAI